MTAQNLKNASFAPLLVIAPDLLKSPQGAIFSFSIKSALTIKIGLIVKMFFNI